jgi:sulfotransferase
MISAPVSSQIHFISGLPRSGSTLLSALLRQNPRFHAGVTSPVGTLCNVLQQQMSANAEHSMFLDTGTQSRLLRGIFNSYYEGNSREVIFDTNRSWTGRLPLLAQLWPKARVICCVRDVTSILDSLERVFASNPVRISRVLNSKSSGSVYARVEGLMNSQFGLVGLAWSTLREAWFGQFSDRLIVVPYNHLTKEPQKVLSSLYTILEEPSFQHDIENVRYEEAEFDAQIGLPGLHTVRSKVEYAERPYILPPDLVAKYAELSFWDRPALNYRGVRILP